MHRRSWVRSWCARLRPEMCSLAGVGAALTEALRGAGLSDPESLNPPQAMRLLDWAERVSDSAKRR